MRKKAVKWEYRLYMLSYDWVDPYWDSYHSTLAGAKKKLREAKKMYKIRCAGIEQCTKVYKWESVK